LTAKVFGTSSPKTMLKNESSTVTNTKATVPL
jgi:hypothetical protein